MDTTPPKIINFRETIGGIEVVDAVFADRLLATCLDVVNRHREWRLSTIAYTAESSNTNKNRMNRRRVAYRKARVELYMILAEATGEPNEPM